MAAISEYPPNTELVRGDPVTIPVNITVDGVPQDVSTFDWRAQIRTAFDGTLVTEFECTVVTPSGGSVPSTVELHLTADKAELLVKGQVFDLEQLDSTTGETIRTWWICRGINVTKDVSTDVALLAKRGVQTERRTI